MSGGSRRRCVAFAIGVLAMVGGLAALVPPYAFRGDSEAVIDHLDRPAWARAQPFRVMSLNLGHGRGEGVHQLLTSDVGIHDNLERVAGLLKREAPHVVALQEADGPSIWSGGFDHVATLAEAGRRSPGAFAGHLCSPARGRAVGRGFSGERGPGPGTDPAPRQLIHFGKSNSYTSQYVCRCFALFS